MFRTDPATTTAWNLDISSPMVWTIAKVRISNNPFGGSYYLYSTTDYASLYVPGDAQATVTVSEFMTSPLASPECQQRFVLSLWNSTQTYQLCRYVQCAAVNKGNAAV